jgi:phospholipid transport system substrate-binding protein
LGRFEGSPFLGQSRKRGELFVRKLMTCALSIIVCGAFTHLSHAWAAEPMDRIQELTDQMMVILQDHSLEDQPEVKKQRIWDIASPWFDFEEMSRRTLALHWKERTPDERQEFVDLFSHLLHRTYVDKIDKYTDQTVSYLGEDIRGQRAQVATKIVGTESEIEVYYRLKETSSGWLIYDVIIEGVSLVGNYRTQFHDIVLSDGYPELIRRLRKKLEERGEGSDLEEQESS